MTTVASAKNAPGTTCSYDYGACAPDEKYGFLDADGTTCRGRVECDGDEATGKYVYPYYSIDAAPDKTDTYSDASKWTFDVPPPRGVPRNSAAFEDTQYFFASSSADASTPRRLLSVRCRGEKAGDTMHIRYNPPEKDKPESFTCTPMEDKDVCFIGSEWGLYDATKKECSTAALKDDAVCYRVDPDTGKRREGALMTGAAKATYKTNPCVLPEKDDATPWWVWVIAAVVVLLVLGVVVAGAVMLLSPKKA